LNQGQELYFGLEAPKDQAIK